MCFYMFIFIYMFISKNDIWPINGSTSMQPKPPNETSRKIRGLWFHGGARSLRHEVWIGGIGFFLSEERGSTWANHHVTWTCLLGDVFYFFTMVNHDFAYRAAQPSKGGLMFRRRISPQKRLPERVMLTKTYICPGQRVKCFLLRDLIGWKKHEFLKDLYHMGKWCGSCKKNDSKWWDPWKIDQPIEHMTNCVVPSYLSDDRNFNLWPIWMPSKQWLFGSIITKVCLMASTREGIVELNKTFQEMVGGNMIEKNHPEIYHMICR